MKISKKQREQLRFDLGVLRGIVLCSEAQITSEREIINKVLNAVIKGEEIKYT